MQARAWAGCAYRDVVVHTQHGAASGGHVVLVNSRQHAAVGVHVDVLVVVSGAPALSLHGVAQVDAGGVVGVVGASAHAQLRLRQDVGLVRDVGAHVVLGQVHERLVIAATPSQHTHAQSHGQE